MATASVTKRGGGGLRLASAQHELTLEQFLRLPEAEPALEFEDGRVTQKVSPKGQHSTLQGALVEIVNRKSRRRKVVHAFPELRTTYGGRSFVPDVAVYRLERIPHTPDGKVANDFLAPPDIAIEIVSPRQTVNALVRRCLRYVALGVRAALLVDPDDESVILFRPDGSAVALRGAGEVDLGDIAPGFRLTVADLFARLRIG